MTHEISWALRVACQSPTGEIRSCTRLAVLEVQRARHQPVFLATGDPNLLLVTFTNRRRSIKPTGRQLDRLSPSLRALNYLGNDGLAGSHLCKPHWHHQINSDASLSRALSNQLRTSESISTFSLSPALKLDEQPSDLCLLQLDFNFLSAPVSPHQRSKACQHLQTCLRVCLPR